MGDLQGKVALVTGASRGIGQAIARELANAGASLLLAARGEEACRALADEIGASADACYLDVADYDSVKAAVGAAISRFGRLDILINNAGVNDPIGLVGNADPAGWARCIEINLIGVHNMVHASLPMMRASGEGVIVNISSGAAFLALEGWSAYCASKAGVAMLTASIAEELSGEGIRVYGLQPGTVETAMQQKIRAAGYSPVAQMQPADHLPAEVPARAVAFLCSDGGKRFNGRELRVSDKDLCDAMAAS